MGLPPWETLRRAESPRATQGTFIWEMGRVSSLNGVYKKERNPDTCYNVLSEMSQTQKDEYCMIPLT